MVGKDSIIHNTMHTFKFWDRIKILLGKELTIYSEIETNHEEVSLSGKVECRTSIARLFPRKLSKGGLIGNIENTQLINT